MKTRPATLRRILMERKALVDRAAEELRIRKHEE
jgi:hypothetical protein